MVGLAVGELAARGRNHRAEASERRQTLALLHSVTELVAPDRTAGPSSTPPSAEPPATARPFATATSPDTTRAGSPPASPPTATSPWAGQSWTTEDLGLPTRRVDLPVRSGGWLLGHFLLTPTPGRPVLREQLVVAIAIADQVGSSLMADQTAPTTRA